MSISASMQVRRRAANAGDCTSQLAASLIDDSVARLDPARLGIMIEAIRPATERKDHIYPMAEERLRFSFGHDDDAVREREVL